MNIELNEIPCIKLDYADFGNQTILSFELNKQLIKSALQEYDVEKVINFNDNINFQIQIDSVNTFDSINLKTISYAELQHYNGNRVYSCIVGIAPKQEDEELTFYYRVKIDESENPYIIKSNGVEGIFDFAFISDWSEPCSITIKQNYTLNILHAMYDFIADYNAYNKEVKSANFYSFLVSHAVELNKAYQEILKTKDMFLIERCDTNELNNVFGYNYGFNIPFYMNTEEYRRLMIELRKSYLNAGTFESIANVLYYFFGIDVEYKDYKDIYPWILRNEEIEAVNPSYTNYLSNYYLYSQGRLENKKYPNEIMLLSDKFAKFCFEIKTDNFFNCDFDIKDVMDIINKLKPVYTKCILDLNEYEKYEEIDYTNPLLIDDNHILAASDNTYIQYK